MTAYVIGHLTVKDPVKWQKYRERDGTSPTRHEIIVVRSR